jgi:hypothetical protein
MVGDVPLAAPGRIAREPNVQPQLCSVSAVPLW